MSKEQDLLDDIFGENIKWKDKYKISYCDHCRTWTMQCEKCNNSSCNGSSCPECHEDSVEFNKIKTAECQYLSEEEMKVWYKIRSLHKFIKQMLSSGKKEMDWWEICKTLASQHDYELFDELKPYREKADQYWADKLNKMKMV